MALPKIDVPVYETKLISNGKTIKFRPFLVKEQKLFLMATESNDVLDTIKVVKQVLNNCILSEIDVDSLATFDVEYIFMQLRARSVGEVVNLKYNCNNLIKDEKDEDKVCGNLLKFDVNVLEIQPTINETHTNKIELSPKLGIILKYPTFDTASKLEQETNIGIDMIINSIIECIDYIYDEETLYYAKDTPKEELVEFIENLQQNDLTKIQNFFDTMPKIIKKIEFKCAKCGYNEDIKVEGIQSFFG